MAEHSTVSDYLRPWFPTEEDGMIDARTAWLHFEPLWTSLGYSICYGKVDEDCKLRTPPIMGQNAVGDPFHPTPTGPFVHSLPGGLDNSVYRTYDSGWALENPRLTLAYDNQNRLVVIKVLETSDPRTAVEVDMLLYLNSQTLRSSPKNHTIPVFGHVDAEGWSFLIMPAWNMSCFPPHLLWHIDEYFELMIQTLEGLAFMHEHGVAHRDISRRNILFNQDGTCTIRRGDKKPFLSTWDVRLAFIDFGLSEKFAPGTDPNTWVVSNSWGTPRNMAPEVSSAEEKSSPYQALPADVYALAKVWRGWLDFEEEIIQSEIERDSTKLELETCACKVLQKHVPDYMQLLGEMLDDDPGKRPTAADALSRFQAMRENVPEHIRFSPPDGYPKTLA